MKKFLESQMSENFKNKLLNSINLKGKFLNKFPCIRLNKLKYIQTENKMCQKKSKTVLKFKVGILL